MGSVLSRPLPAPASETSGAALWEAHRRPSSQAVQTGAGGGRRRQEGAGRQVSGQLRLRPSIFFRSGPTRRAPRGPVAASCCSNEVGRSSGARFRPPTGSDLLQGGGGGVLRFLSVPSAAAASSAPPTELPGVGISSVPPIGGQKHAYTCCPTRLSFLSWTERRSGVSPHVASAGC